MHTRTLLASLSICALLAPAVARAEKITVDEDTFFNIGALIQPQLTLGEKLTPDEGWNSDFFIRRARLVLSGQLDPHVGFVFITDQANWGKNGEYNSQFIVQDAVASYKFGPELTIDAGFMLLPFLRHNFLSAGALNTVDFRAGIVKFPTGNAFRDMGVEVRGLLANDLVYYRAGVFNGVAGRVNGTMPSPEGVNESDVPRFTGTARVNLAGKEEAYAFSGIYFAKEPVISVGVGADFQPDAYADAAGNSENHLGLNADVFLDFPLDDDNEVVASAAFIYYDRGAPGAEAATAFYLEAGYRWMWLEPVVTLEYFQGDGDDSPRQTTLRPGVNFWVTQHKYNVKAELAVPMNEDPPMGEANNNLTATIQTQLVF